MTAREFGRQTGLSYQRMTQHRWYTATDRDGWFGGAPTVERLARRILDHRAQTRRVETVTVQGINAQGVRLM